jgi:multiple antibiotic resistance protein
MNLFEYILLAGSSLFVILDPIATVPAFLAMTPNDTAEERIRMARLACIVTAGVLLFFSITGHVLFKLVGITLEAFQMAGSIVLLIVALDMLKARRSPVQQTVEETRVGLAKEDIAITPLAMPMLAGPGAITTSILLNNQAPSLTYRLALYGCIVVVSMLCFFMLRWAALGARWMNPIAMKITTRIMGLLLAALAIQFMINALIQLAPKIKLG